jgi:translation initiation factor IF-2
MAENKEMRLSLAAKKLGVGIVTIVERLTGKGSRVENNPNTKLNFEQLQILSKEFSNPSLLEESAVTKTVEEPKTSTGNADILYFREQPKTETPKVVEPPKPKPEPEIIRAKVEGLTILGKIDLDKKPTPPVSQPQKEDITPINTQPSSSTIEQKVETPTEKPIVEEKTIEIQPKKEVETPTVVEKSVIEEQAKTEEPKQIVVAVETPKTEPLKELPKTEKTQLDTTKIEKNQLDSSKNEVKQQATGTNYPQNRQNFPQKNQNKPNQQQNKPKQNNQGGGNQQPRPPKQEHIIPQRQAPNPNQLARRDDKKTIVKPIVVEEEEQVELIMAKADKLQGLKVLGKIELPVEKKIGGGGDDRGDKKKRKRKRVKRAEKVTNIPDNAPKKEVKDNKGQSSNNQNKGGNSGNKKKERKEEVSQTEVKEQIKQTMARMQTKGPDFGAKFRKEKRKHRAEQEEQRLAAEQEESKLLKVTEFISAADLASMMDVSVNQVISTCMKMGMFVSINQRLDAEAIQLIALEFGFDTEFISAEEEIQAVTEEEDAPETLEARAPIVTIMGHVDHGKTSLLDYIRRTKVAAGEAGGITQHIGAYSVKVKEGANKGKMITFLDTPGHEAFTAMRARGAKVTDVAIIVVAADDSVMPQTREAINHAQNAGVPIVFAMNKIDKAGANPQKIREDLANENILVESWGGKYQEQEVSAKQGIGINDLLDKVLLESEILDLKANPNKNAVGTVIEAELDKGRGYLVTILVQSGTLRVGDVILAGQYFGRVRAMIDDLGNRIKEAGPSTPVQILGLPGAPQAGDKFNVMSSEREAREIANKREQIIREQGIRASRHITLEEIGRRKAIGNFHQLNVIVKGDVDGSVQALSDSLLKLSTEEVQVQIIHKGVGQISESDVLLASTGDAIIVGFQVRPSNNARRIADQEQIEIRLYSVIYDAINEIKDAMEGLLEPTQEEVITGNIEVREVFKISKIGTVAGCYVLDGVIKRNNRVRLVREGIVVHEGEISALKRFKDDVNEVKAGFECGLSIKGLNDIQVGDTIENFEMKEVKRTL